MRVFEHSHNFHNENFAFFIKQIAPVNRKGQFIMQPEQITFR